MKVQYLAEQPIRWEDLLKAQESRAAQEGWGAVVTFLGIVRADSHGGGKVKALFYEAYAEMAEFQIGQLVTQAQIPHAAVWIRHRLGQVEVGQIGVAIVVAAAHRAEAYAACRFLIEGIKQRVPIWKQEHYEDGRAQWVGCREDDSKHAHV